MFKLGYFGHHENEDADRKIEQIAKLLYESDVTYSPARWPTWEKADCDTKASYSSRAQRVFAIAHGQEKA